MSAPVDPMVQIARDMRKLPETTRRAVRPRLRRAGEIVRTKAQANASWSSRIPSSIKVVTSFRENREGVTVRAGGVNAPHARPFEGMTTRGNTFRHPVYGNDWWVAQATRPFLMPAAEAGQAQADAEVRAALDDAAASLGFEG
jgi:hypothetical protein